ncbi:hypothetical protein C8R45DRAFT_923352 [Mycena sanguinolenta]|nr:hypothetical protein C8R45DRAFT_923352 [Mycena sanguinolenta]
MPAVPPLLGIIISTWWESLVYLFKPQWMVGSDIKQIILLGKTLNHFNAAFQIYMRILSDLFNWLWLKIIQRSLDDFIDYWNNHKIRTPRNKLLPSGVSPKYIWDFPEKFGLTHFGAPAPPQSIATLQQNIPKSRDKCYCWVSDEFNLRAWAVYVHIGEPKLILTDGWNYILRDASTNQFLVQVVIKPCITGAQNHHRCGYSIRNQKGKYIRGVRESSELGS